MKPNKYRYITATYTPSANNISLLLIYTLSTDVISASIIAIYTLSTDVLSASIIAIYTLLSTNVISASIIAIYTLSTDVISASIIAIYTLYTDVISASIIAIYTLSTNIHILVLQLSTHYLLTVSIYYLLRKRLNSCQTRLPRQVHSLQVQGQNPNQNAS